MTGVVIKVTAVPRKCSPGGRSTIGRDTSVLGGAGGEGSSSALLRTKRIALTGAVRDAAAA